MHCIPTEYIQTYSSAGRPASRFPARDLNGVPLILAIDGQKCSGSYESAGPVGCLLRTLVTSSIWRSTLYGLTWKRKVTKSGRSYCQLSPSVRPIVGIDASWWRTPVAADAANREFYVNSRGEPMLSGQVKQAAWPTPTARDYKDGDAKSCQNVPVNGLLGRAVHAAWPTPSVHGNHNRVGSSPNAGDGLSTAAKAWPTVRASDGAHGGPNQRDSSGSQGLPSAVCKAWTTPIAADAVGTTAGTDRARSLRADTRNPSGGQLNPDWVECLMAFPIGWTR